MLKDALVSYIALQRTCGLIFTDTGATLESFVRFATQRGDEHIRAETAIAWAGSSKSPARRRSRLRAVARFAQHLRAEDSQHEVPPDDLFPGTRRRPVPYIFTEDEIQQILRETQRLPPTTSIRPLSYTTLIGLLASTGLRVGEALRLRLDDVAPDGLVIRETKFRKSRLVPLHESAQVHLQAYLEVRLALRTLTDHLLVDERGHRLSRNTVWSTFHKLFRKLGLRRTGEGPRPMLLSLRHTFAVRALQSCPHSRTAVGRHLLALSTYLGHSSVIATYWYLEATPHLLAQIATACEEFRKESQA